MTTKTLFEAQDTLKVLLFEDTEHQAYLIRNFLEDENLVWKWKTSANQHQQVIDKFKPDIILCDIIMPGEESGFDICKKTKEKYPHVQFMFISTLGSIHEKTEGLLLGADDYLSKPFSPEELQARFKTLATRALFMKTLHQARASKYQQLLCEELEIHVPQHLCLYQNTPLELAPKEFDLLVYFMENSQKSLDRFTILDHVWPNADPDPRTVDTHVKSLRKKLNDTVPYRYIKTLRGQGYLFSPPVHKL